MCLFFVRKTAKIQQLSIKAIIIHSGNLYFLMITFLSEVSTLIKTPQW